MRLTPVQLVASLGSEYAAEAARYIPVGADGKIGWAEAGPLKGLARF
jgi:hypothetical protein